MVDVFAERRYAGNPLAVIVGEAYPPAEEMQRIAAEMNFSETTFVLAEPDEQGSFPMRIFTPSREIEFTGHPLLGTAWIVRRHLAPMDTPVIRLGTPVGDVTVTFEPGAGAMELAWFTAPPITVGRTAEPDALATALGITTDDIDPASPPRVVGAGTSAVIVPLRSAAALRRSRLDLQKYSALAEQGFPPLTYLYTAETHSLDNDVCVRFFFDAHGLREDPATGNGAAFLGAYLLENDPDAAREVSLRIEQGHEVRRPSLIFLRAQRREGHPEIRVGGHVIPTASGYLL